jgi:hypothetical protein
MNIAAPLDAGMQTAISSCVTALRTVADSSLPPALASQMLELGERKEFLTPAEHEQLLALVAFSQQRTVEKLQAELALQQLQAAMPGSGRP